MNILILFYISKKIVKILLEDKKLLQVSFIIICIIHKINVYLKITRILKRFLRSMIDFHFLKQLIFFHNI